MLAFLVSLSFSVLSTRSMLRCWLARIGDGLPAMFRWLVITVWNSGKLSV